MRASPQEFPLGAVVRVARAHRRTLDTWARTSFLPPRIRKPVGTGNRRAYSFADIVATHVAGRCRQRGLTLEGLGQLVAYIQRIRELKDPSLDAPLIMQGNPLAIARGEGQLIEALRETNSREAIDIGRSAAEIRRGLEEAS